ncbi:MAG: hypothetical protein ACP5H7_03260, partial [Minisyncoccia bacterium]
MRFHIQFFSEKEVQIPKNIRNFFISFIKKIFERSDKILYHSLFNSKRAKPYVFSPYLGRKFEEKIADRNVSFIFSSGDYSIISNFWNGLLTLKKEKEDYIGINGEKFYVSSIKILPDKKIKSNEVLNILYRGNKEITIKYKENYQLKELKFSKNYPGVSGSKIDGSDKRKVTFKLEPNEKKKRICDI